MITFVTVVILTLEQHVILDKKMDYDVNHFLVHHMEAYFVAKSIWKRHFCTH